MPAAEFFDKIARTPGAKNASRRDFACVEINFVAVLFQEYRRFSDGSFGNSLRKRKFSAPKLFTYKAKDGEDGNSVSDIKNYYRANTSPTAAPTSGWKASASESGFSSTNKYLWNYEEVFYSKTGSTKTTPRVIAVWGEKGNTGISVTGIEEQYALSTSNTTVTGSWSSNIPTLTATNKYLWNRERTKFDDGTYSAWSTPVIIGVYGDKGVGEVSAFQMAAEQPKETPLIGDYPTFLSTPDTEDLGYGWTKKVVKKNATLVVGGSVTNIYRSNSAWYSETKDDGNTWWRNPSGVGANNSSETKIYFTTSDDNMVVTFYLMASSEANCDFISITEVDSTEIKTRISGNGVTSGALQFEVKTAGTHYVTVTYSKDSSLDRYNDCGYVRLAKDERWVKRYPPIYRCHGVVVNNTIQWGDIIKETGDKGDQGEQGEQGEPGIQGNRGYNGCIFRTSIWKEGVIYRNDTDLEGNGDKYIDIVYVADSSTDTGWRAYKCTETHTSGSTMGSKWEELSGVGPIYTPLILAKNAVLELAQGQSFTLVRNNTLFGCFRWTEQQSDFALWLGASVGNQAPFGVTAGGKVIATNAVIKGEITATKGTFNNCDIKDTCTITKIDAVKGTIAGLQIADSSISATTSTGTMNLTSNGLELLKGNYYARIGTWTYNDVISGTTKTIPNIAVGGVNSSGGLVDVFIATSEGVFMNTKHVQLLSLPTSSTGLKIGEIYNDNGTLKIK